MQYGMTEKRVEWIDVFKLLGIIAIFCGHFGRNTGGLHEFVFYYHVPLFFFSAGIFADSLENLKMGQAVRKKLSQIMLPYLFFSMISMPIILLTTNESIYTYMAYVKQFICGIRNEMYTSSLWFFPCLFCMCIMFDILRRILIKPVLLLLASLLIYFVTVFLLPDNPGVTPSWIFNIDSAMHYMIYYAVGYLLRRKLREERKDFSVWERIFQLAGVVFLTGYVVLIYLQQDIFTTYFYSVIPGIKYVYPIIRTLFLICFQIVLAKLLAGIGNLHEVGTQTMWFCGNEFVVNKIISASADIIGVEIEINCAFSAVIYALMLICFIYKLLLPWEKKLYHKCLEYLSKLKSVK